jgi:hypothetical protein
MRTLNIKGIPKREVNDIENTFSKYSRTLTKMPSVSSMRNGEGVIVDDGTTLLYVKRSGKKLIKFTGTEVV